MENKNFIKNSGHKLEVWVQQFVLLEKKDELEVGGEMQQDICDRGVVGNSWSKRKAIITCACSMYLPYGLGE